MNFSGSFPIHETIYYFEDKNYFLKKKKIHSNMKHTHTRCKKLNYIYVFLFLNVSIGIILSIKKNML